MRVQNTEV